VERFIKENKFSLNDNKLVLGDGKSIVGSRVEVFQEQCCYNSPHQCSEMTVRTHKLKIEKNQIIAQRQAGEPYFLLCTTHAGICGPMLQTNGSSYNREDNTIEIDNDNIFIKMMGPLPPTENCFDLNRDDCTLSGDCEWKQPNFCGFSSCFKGTCVEKNVKEEELELLREEIKRGK